MARPSRTGGKTSEAKARNASPAKGRKPSKTKRRIAPAATRVKRRSVPDLTLELQEAREQQAATAEILEVIASSPSNVQPVFEAIAASALRLCGAKWSVVTRFDGAQLHLAALHNLSDPEGVDAIRKIFPRPLSRGGPTDRAILTGTVISLPDVLKDPEYIYQSISNSAGYRSHLAVPMSRDGNAVGAITVAGEHTAAFTERHVILLKAFADQAVIAIENARLFNEVQAKTRHLEESLQQQTATADVLKVISRSAFDLDTVMNTLAASANSLCGSRTTALFLRDGDTLVCRGVAAITPDIEEFVKANPVKLNSDSHMGRALLTGTIVNVGDFLKSNTKLRKFQTAMGFRSFLAIPLMREGRGIGVFTLGRDELGTFSQRQVDLVQAFADQAVIAIENVRLFDEVQAKTRDLTEALTYQTGSGNILKVIASSPTDVGPVLKAIVETACELCEAYDSVLVLKDGQDLRFSAHHGPIPMTLVKWPINRNWTAGRAFVDQRPVHVHDLQSPEGDDFPDGREMSRRMGHRTILSVPLLSEGESIGTIVLRRTEVHPFNDKQINLLQTFADQAVIAIGNVRLFEEVQTKTRDLTESLQQQTATADVLKVISRSAFDLHPVLETLVESAAKLCDADKGFIFQRSGELYHLAVNYGFSSEFEEFTRRNPVRLGRDTITGRAALEGRTVHIPDVLADTEYSGGAGAGYQALGRYRSGLGVPLLRGSETIGVFTLTRPEVRPFTDKQIELVTTFADQAVIAIENVRLFDEVQAKTRDLSESLQQQTAMSEVLQVISSSPGELEPVFQTMLENATRICAANFGTMYRYDGAFHLMASHNAPLALVETRLRTPVHLPPPDTGLGRLERTKQVVHIHDIATEPGYTTDHSYVAGSKLSGARTVLIVPMLKDAELAGSINIFRQEVRPFTDKQVELLSNFAKQAVIAIENARLLKELRQRTDDLSQSLDDLRAAQDRLVQTEKLASLGQLTAGIAHEIKNPLNFVNNFSALTAELTDELNDLLKPAPLDDKMRGEADELTGMIKDNLEKVVQHGKRADSIVKNMLLHSREGSREHRPADINSLLDESLNLAYHGARAEKGEFNITLQRDFDADAGTIELFPQEITRAFLNLIANGVYAATKRKTEDKEPGFEPTLRASTKNLGTTVEIRVRDNGTGISAEVREKMFNPFFTTKKAGEGTGLGLSMTHDIIVKQHGGRIDVATEPGQFTEFIIVLPRKSNFSGKGQGET